MQPSIPALISINRSGDDFSLTLFADRVEVVNDLAENTKDRA